MNATPDSWATYLDDAWLGQVQEDVLEPDIAIVDPHFHLMTTPFRYELPAWIADLKSGHKVVGTVHTQAGTGHYRTTGPDHLKALGETEYLMDVVEKASKIPDAPTVISGLIAGADLTRDPGQIDELLDGHLEVSKGRFKGIRINLFWKYEKDGSMVAAPGSDAIAERAELRAGIACLAKKNLTLDLICYHSNLEQVAALAKAMPNMTFVVNHLGIIVDTSKNPASEADMMQVWRKGIEKAAAQPNVKLKVGGCANPIVGVSMSKMKGIRQRPKPLTSTEFADIYRPWVSHAIDKFGPKRCILESNFPMDKGYANYRVLWNGFKRLTQDYSADEKRAMYSGNAAATYKLAI